MAGLTKQTKTLSEKDIHRTWHLCDAHGQVLGRFATKISSLLSGKDKTTYAPHMDNGDFVVVINARNIKVTGKKEQNKVYTSYSGYPGGLKEIPYYRLHTKDPRKIIQHAVSGMLSKNKLRDKRMKRLYVFPEAEHTFTDKFNH